MSHHFWLISYQICSLIYILVVVLLAGALSSRLLHCLFLDRMHRLTPFELHVAKQHRCSNLAVIQFQMREQLSQLDAI